MILAGDVHQEQVVRYEIRVEGVLDESWSSWFDGMEISREGDAVTVISGEVGDQAALHGMLRKVCDLGLDILCVCRRPPE